MMRHCDLTSGIGGFALGFQWAGLSYPVLFCDIEPWCRQILNKHWPDVPIAEDVKVLANDPDRNVPDCDILTAGFPCQPWSVAGRSRSLKESKKDPRHIWPWIIDIVKQKRPTWVVFENVPHLASLGGLDEVITDLEIANYATTTLNISAVGGTGAPHKRERLWIIAKNVENTRHGTGRHKWVAETGQDPSGEWAAHTNKASGSGKQSETQDGWSVGSEFCSVADGLSTRLGGLREHEGWEKEPEGMTRVAVGVPDRVSKLKGLGNAILPQIAERIGVIIKQVEELNE
tara:strand:- start:265 stop:1128 length:864 start_codon:yes stop_codon:yes gene_type:complete